MGKYRRLLPVMAGLAILLVLGSVMTAVAAGIDRSNPRQGQAATPQTLPSTGPFQWVGLVTRGPDGYFVLQRRCDSWLLGVDSEEAQETLRKHLGSRVDVWGVAGADVALDRQAVVVRAVYGPEDPRPLVLVPDYPCPQKPPANDGDADAVGLAGGTVATVDTEHMVLVIRTADGPQRFRVTSDTGVAIDGSRVRFGQLEPGMRVRVYYQAEGSVALRIMAVSTQDEPPSKTGLAGGTVASVDTEEMVLVIRTADGPQRFRVTSDTGVAIDGTRVRFGELEPGMRVRVYYQAEGSVALRIMAVSESGGSARGTAGRDPAARAAEAQRR